jgi:hypothetical protein
MAIAFWSNPKSSNRQVIGTVFIPTNSEIAFQTKDVTEQEHKRCFDVSTSKQKTQVISATVLRLAKLSLVSDLFLLKSHRKTCILGGIVIHIAGV